MKICFPVREFNGLASGVFGHFGSATGFIVVDEATGAVEEIRNGDAGHAHGQCQPIKAIGGREIDCVAVGGIGMGAIRKLNLSGIKVYRAVEGSIEENLALLQKGGLPLLDESQACAHHHGDGGCEH